MIYFLLAMGSLDSSCGKKEDPNLDDVTIEYTFPEESEEHESSWLQWPHHLKYGIVFRDDIEQTLLFN